MSEFPSVESLRSIEVSPDELLENYKRALAEIEDQQREIKRLHSHGHDLAAEITSQRAEIERLQQWVNDLQAGMFINCVYCGHRYGPDDEVPATMADVLKEHVEQCPEHPMSALRAQVAEQSGEIQRLRLQVAKECLCDESKPNGTDLCNVHAVETVAGLRVQVAVLTEALEPFEPHPRHPGRYYSNEWLQRAQEALASTPTPPDPRDEQILDELLYDEMISAGRHRELTGLNADQQRERWRKQICANCGHQHTGEPPYHCRDCDWPLAERVVPDAPLCSVCRRRHGAEVKHACE